MTDGRIPGKWVSEPRFAEMPDATFGFFARALAWSNEAGTDGHVKRRYLAQLHSTGEQQPAVYEQLAAAGLWKPTNDGYQFINWDTPAHRGGLGQSLAASVQAGKQRNKEKQQRFRDRAKGEVSPPSDQSRNPVTFPGDVGHDTTRKDRLITGEVSENEKPTESSADDLVVDFDEMQVNARTGEVVELFEGSTGDISNATLPVGSPMAIAAEIRSQLRDDPGYCSKHGGPWPCKKHDDGCRRAA